jgi:hypothetical protein
VEDVLLALDVLDALDGLDRELVELGLDVLLGLDALE